MTFFESLLLLVAIAVLLLQVSRRVGIPYPTMLAGAGVLLGLLPSAPNIRLDPHTVLALFIAPVLVDAAFDFPLATVRLLWRPLFALAVVAVVLSAGVVVWLGVSFAGLPLYAALALGAIVAPPDAAAATALLRTVKLPRRSVAVLKGESLLNDASALLLFSAAVAFHGHASSGPLLAARIGFAVPGGVALGIVLAKMFRHVVPFVSGTLGGTLVEFVTAFGVWTLAERLGLSAVLCLVAFAMTIARQVTLTTKPRARIHSFAVWDSVVFLLNVLAFLLMGLQVRSITAGMDSDHLRDAAWFAAAVVAALLVVRVLWLLVYNRLAHRFRVFRGDFEPATLRHSLLVGWCGMRGLVTLATAFALPADFPRRDLLVLTAFAVVVATLVIQGLTLGPLVRLLKLDGDDGLDDELDAARVELAAAALETLDDASGVVAEHWKWAYGLGRTAARPGGDRAPLEEKRRLGLAAKRRERERLEQLREEGHCGADAYLILQEELDFAEVSLTTENERRIEES